MGSTAILSLALSSRAAGFAEAPASQCKHCGKIHKYRFLLQANEDLTKVSKDDRGYDYVETSDWLTNAVRVLPCFAALEWPTYATKVVSDVTIGGKAVIIQLWKGWCQQFLSSSRFPGGVGAEVGVYEIVSNKGFPSERPEWFPANEWCCLQELSKRSGTRFWYPVAEKHDIEFELINPKTGEAVFKTQSLDTYWCNKWMDTASHKKYKRSTGKRWDWLPVGWFGNTRTPLLAKGYTLRYRINGVDYPEWAGSK